MLHTTHSSSQTNHFEVGDQDFETRILKTAEPVVVDFTATWCPPCRALDPVYHQLSQEYQGRMAFASLDIDQNPQTAERYRILGAPTLIVFKDGQELARIVGPAPRRLKTQLDHILAESIS